MPKTCVICRDELPLYAKEDEQFFETMQGTVCSRPACLTEYIDELESNLAYSNSQRRKTMKLNGELRAQVAMLRKEVATLVPMSKGGTR